MLGVCDGTLHVEEDTREGKADCIVEVPGGIKLCTLERIMTLKLRGEMAAFQTKVGRCHGVEREERVCKECDSGEDKNVWHRLRQCSAWEHLQQPLLKALFEETEDSR